jgi:hypothetical protein
LIKEHKQFNQYLHLTLPLKRKVKRLKLVVIIKN